MKIIKRVIKKVVLWLGYELKRKGQRPELFVLKLNSYFNEEGVFNYQSYRKIQEEGNKKKIETVWVKEQNIEYLSNYILNNLAFLPEKGICHGTRQGKEQEWFNKYLGCQVIGTEISETAMDFPNTIQWDFHEIKPEWEGAFDFVYSNSFDHAYDPEK